MEEYVEYLNENISAQDREIEQLNKEIDRLNKIIDEALDRLTIKINRYYNEKDYQLNDEDLDEIMKVLVLKEEPKEIPQFEGTMKQLDDLCDIKKEEEFIKF